MNFVFVIRCQFMTSFITHMSVGIIFAEIILRIRIKDVNERTDNRVRYWWIGLFGGLIPDLDFIPAIILGVHTYTFHHIVTHTFLALGIVALFTLVIFRNNPLSLPFLTGYSMHMGVDFVDNSITPLGPFDSITEWGLLAGWRPLPGGSWSNEYWLPPWGPLLYGNHDLWSIFMNNGWGIPIGFEFLSYYDLLFIGLFGFFIVYLLIQTIKPYFG